VRTGPKSGPHTSAMAFTNGGAPMNRSPTTSVSTQLLPGVTWILRPIPAWNCATASA
jgi:hypothetical protein